jgi:hypothetical protein
VNVTLEPADLLLQRRELIDKHSHSLLHRHGQLIRLMHDGEQ